MHIFYTPEIQPDAKEHLLNPEESKHAVRVLRLREGQSLLLVDGAGTLKEAVITTIDNRETRLRIVSTHIEYGKSPYNLHMAVAPTKNIDRFEWFIEKATEVGIHEITPIICNQSERKQVKQERLERVAVAAMKQSQKAYLPKINPAVNFVEFIQESQSTTVFKGIAHCEDHTDKQYLSDHLSAGEDAILLIGPEGDFSEREINESLASGFSPITLGESRLRTETAALYCCMEIAFLNR